MTCGSCKPQTLLQVLGPCCKPGDPAAGAAHESGALEAVLGGRMLQEWRQRALELQEDGWCAPKQLTGLMDGQL